MAEANEELVRRYFELKGYFVRSNTPYIPPGGGGWSDVDLCIYHPRTGDCAAVEVKGWHTERITPSYFKEWPQLFHFTRPEARHAVAELLGREDFKHILVVGRIGANSRVPVTAYARERGVEILEFPDVLAELVRRVPVRQSAATDGEHAIRVLKAYGFLDQD